MIGDHFTGTQITALFGRAGYPDVVHDGGTKWRFVAGAFDSLQRRDESANCVLAIVKRAGSPEGWIGRREEYDSFLSAVNAVLEFYGLALKDDGRLVRTGTTATTVGRDKSDDQIAFESRSFHPAILRHSRSHFLRGAYFHAVFEACKALDSSVRASTLREKSGQPSVDTQNRQLIDTSKPAIN
ncbi:MAG TPA: TIGR02391 family protein [Vicinamibacterales bacterium]|nr:TIGR02391 family protein [Vicinamibacterales bacterium]